MTGVSTIPPSYSLDRFMSTEEDNTMENNEEFTANGLLGGPATASAASVDAAKPMSRLLLSKGTSYNIALNVTNGKHYAEQMVSEQGSAEDSFIPSGLLGSGPELLESDVVHSQSQLQGMLAIWW
jgi:hypothetical protein